MSGGLQRHVWAWLHREQLHLASADRLTELGRRTAAIAHELNTPLAAASNALHEAGALQQELCESLVHPDVGELDLVETAEDLSSEIEAARASMARMAEFLSAIQSQAVARPRGAQMEQIFFLRPRLEGVLEMLARAGDARAARVELGGVDARAQLRGDPGSFDQLILILLDNALAQPSASGRVWVEMDFSGAQGRLVVRDEGPGVQASMRERIFEAMVTTRAAQGHAGMGLAIGRDIARGIFAGELRLLPTQEGELRAGVSVFDAAPPVGPELSQNVPRAASCGKLWRRRRPPAGASVTRGSDEPSRPQPVWEYEPPDHGRDRRHRGADLGRAQGRARAGASLASDIGAHTSGARGVGARGVGARACRRALVAPLLRVARAFVGVRALDARRGAVAGGAGRGLG